MGKSFMMRLILFWSLESATENINLSLCKTQSWNQLNITFHNFPYKMQNNHVVRGKDSSQCTRLMRTLKFYSPTLNRRDRGIYTALTLLLIAKVYYVLGNMDGSTALFPSKIKEYRRCRKAGSTVEALKFEQFVL